MTRVLFLHTVRGRPLLLGWPLLMRRSLVGMGRTCVRRPLMVHLWWSLMRRPLMVRRSLVHVGRLLVMMLTMLMLLLLQLLQLELLPLKLLQLLVDNLVLLRKISRIHSRHHRVHTGHWHSRHAKGHTTERHPPGCPHWSRHDLLLFLELGRTVATHSQAKR